MARRRKAHGFTSASVALVDVTSNGLALVLVLIVVSLANGLDLKGSKGHEEELKSMVVARRVANVVAHDQLPVTGGATLHDYAYCDAERAKAPGKMPSIELHEEFVRITDTHVDVSKLELLRDHNPIDDFAKDIRRRVEGGERDIRIRCAVYSVRLYYLALSILIEHKVGIPSDWHWMGESAAERPAKGERGPESIFDVSAEAEPSPSPSLLNAVGLLKAMMDLLLGTRASDSKAGVVGLGPRASGAYHTQPSSSSAAPTAVGHGGKPTAGDEQSFAERRQVGEVAGAGFADRRVDRVSEGSGRRLTESSTVGMPAAGSGAASLVPIASGPAVGSAAGSGSRGLPLPASGMSAEGAALSYGGSPASGRSIMGSNVAAVHSPASGELRAAGSAGSDVAGSPSTTHRASADVGDPRSPWRDSLGTLSAGAEKDSASAMRDPSRLPGRQRSEGRLADHARSGGGHVDPSPKNGRLRLDDDLGSVIDSVEFNLVNEASEPSNRDLPVKFRVYRSGFVLMVDDTTLDRVSPPGRRARDTDDVVVGAQSVEEFSRSLACHLVWSPRFQPSDSAPQTPAENRQIYRSPTLDEVKRARALIPQLTRLLSPPDSDQETGRRRPKPLKLKQYGDHQVTDTSLVLPIEKPIQLASIQGVPLMLDALVGEGVPSVIVRPQAFPRGGVRSTLSRDAFLMVGEQIGAGPWHSVVVVAPGEHEGQRGYLALAKQNGEAYIASDLNEVEIDGISLRAADRPRRDPRRLLFWMYGSFLALALTVIAWKGWVR